MSNNPYEKYYKLASNTLLFALGNFGSKILVFLLVPLYTNMLTTAEYGVSEILLTAVNLVIPFVSLSIQDATLRFALDKKNRNGVVLKNTMTVLLIGTIVTCLLYPLIDRYKAITGWSGYFVIITIVYMFRNALSVYVKAVGNSTLFAIDSIVYTAILMVTNILFLAVFKWGLKGYFSATILSTIISVLFLFYFGKVFQSCRKSKVNKLLLKKMVGFSIPMVLNNVSWWIISSSDKIMIERMMSIDDSGIYSVAAKMPAIITTITSIFNQAWVISSITEYDSSKDESFFSNTFSAFNFVLVFFASFIVAIIKPFMQVYVGKNFVECWKFVPLLLLGSIFQAYATFFGAIYTSVKKNVNVMTTTFLAAGVNIILNIFLIPIIGIQGAVISTAMAYLMVFVFRMLDSRRYFKFHIDFLKVITSNIILILQCVFVIGNIHPILVSIFCFGLLLIINHKSMMLLIENLYKSLNLIIMKKGKY